MPILPLSAITDTLLDEGSSSRRLKQALDQFAQLCGAITGIIPNPSFDAWANDTFLEHGMAINPEAAAYCIKDYQRSVVFIRAANAAIKAVQDKFTGTPIRILYAGCGPFATLLLPLLNRFEPGELDISLLDIHQESLDSVSKLIKHFGFCEHAIQLVRDDACGYQHPDALHLIIAETMQKALEQEPQFAVTANLAPQLCAKGIFIPEKIEVELSLVHLGGKSTTGNTATLPVCKLFTLLPEPAASQLREAKYNTDTSTLELGATQFQIPELDLLERYEAIMLTRIQAFKQYRLNAYEADITLPMPCPDLSPLRKGASYRVNYQLGSYPKFHITRADQIENVIPV